MPNILKPDRAFNRGGEVVAVFQDRMGNDFEMALSPLALSRFVAMLYEARGEVFRKRIE